MKNVFGSGPPIHKQIKTAIQEGNEDKATALFLSKDGSKLHPSRPLPTKKIPSSEDTAIHYASRYAMAKLFKVFLEYNGNPGILNARKENCGHSACQMASFPYKRAEILDLIYSWRGKTEENLVDFVDIDQVDVNGNTALHLAAASNLLPCIEKLVQFGADLGIVNLENLTCSDLADRVGHYSVATMLEIGKIFTPGDEAKEATQNYRKFTSAIADAKLVPECHSVNLMGLVQFMDTAVMTTAEVLNETAARSEVLLNLYGWDFKRLKRDFEQNPSHVLTAANIKPRVLATSDGKKTDIHVGIPIEEMYFDPNYANVGQFTVFQEGRKKVFSAQNIDGIVGFYPVDYNPSLKFLDSQHISETSHVKPKKTDACPLCGKVMLEAASLQHFLTGTLVDPLLREVHCSSGHKFCFSCWSDYVISQLKREHSAGCLPCPSVGCGEVLDLQWAHIILRKKPDLKNRLYAQRQKHVSESLNLCLCPHPECELWVSVQHPDDNGHDESGLDPLQKPPKSAICSNGHSFCLECHHEAHTPCSCIQLITWNNMLKDETSRSHGHEEATALASVLHYPKSKKCPKCTATISKVTSGCNIVICTNCRTEICFLCLETWSQHGIHHGEVVFCNVYQGSSPLSPNHNTGAGGVFEEKVDDMLFIHHKQKLLKTTRFAHYATRFISHEQSWLMERESKLGAMQRVLEALKLSHTRQLRWLQNEVANPYDEMELEQEEAKIMKNLEEREVGLESFYLPRSQAIAFLEQAFDELERARIFLRWTYPFVLLELEERLLAAVTTQQAQTAQAGQASQAQPQQTAALTRARVEELKQEYLSLQSALEYYTEMLSSYIAQPRIRATKQQIEDMTRKVKSKRIEMERFISEYYLTRKIEHVPLVDANALPSSNSSLTSSSSLKEDSPKKSPTPVNMPMHNLAEEDLDDDEEDDEEESEDDDEDYDIPVKSSPNVRQKPVIQQSNNVVESKSNRAYYRIQETQSSSAVQEAEEQGVDQQQQYYQSSTIMHQKRQEEYEYEQLQQREYERQQQELEYRQQQEIEYRQQAEYERQQAEYERLEYERQEYERQQRLLQQQQQQQQQQQKRVVVQREILPPPPPPQPIIEQRVIGAKKDPDQEALEHAILISKQEDEFGVNMYDALRDEDEPLVEEYMAQGFTREEAILIIFEETFGKVSIQTSRITPAMPTLHKVDSTFGVPVAALQVSEEDEPEVEYYMTKGFTREQAIEVMFANRKKAEEERASEEEARRHEAELIAAEAARSAASRRNLTQRVGSVTNTSNYMSTEDSNNYYSSNQSVRSQGNMSNSYGNTTQDIYESGSSGVDEYELQDLLAQGLTREQAMAILMSQQLTANANNNNNRYAAGNGGDDRSVARSARSFTGRSVQTRSVISEPQQQQGSVYDDGFLDQVDGVVEDEDDDFLEDDPEVSYLMQSGYTREQAIHHIENNRSSGVGGGGGRQSTGGRSSSSAAMLQPPRSSNAENPEVQRYLNQGYSREQATQMALQAFSSSGGMGQSQQQSFRQQQPAQPAVVFQPPVATANQPVFRGASSFVQQGNGGTLPSLGSGGGNSMYGSSYAASNTSRGGYGSQSRGGGGAYSEYNPSDMASSTYYEASVSANNMGMVGDSNYPQPPPPRGDRGMRREDLDMERAMLISQQEAEFGTNMYEILTPANGPEIDEMLNMGYAEDEAVQWIFDRRYRYGITAQPPPLQQQRQQQQMMQQAQPAPAPQYYQQQPAPQMQRPQLMPQQSQAYYPSPQQQISPQPNYHGNSMYSANQSFNNGSSMYGSSDRGSHSAPRQNMSRAGSNYGDVYTSNNNTNSSFRDDRRNSSQYSSQDNSPTKPKKVFRGASILGLGGGGGNASKVKASDLKRLEKMGFDRDRSIRALLAHNNDVNEAAAALSGVY